jgi:hypothetical protein
LDHAKSTEEKNPARADLVEKEQEYLYSSSRNYAGMKGLIEVDLW